MRGQKPAVVDCGIVRCRSMLKPTPSLHSLLALAIRYARKSLIADDIELTDVAKAFRDSAVARRSVSST
jgi:hypothetical protein